MKFVSRFSNNMLQYSVCSWARNPSPLLELGDIMFMSSVLGQIMPAVQTVALQFLNIYATYHRGTFILRFSGGPDGRILS